MKIHLSLIQNSGGLSRYTLQAAGFTLLRGPIAELVKKNMKKILILSLLSASLFGAKPVAEAGAKSAELHAAIRHGNFSQVKALLDAGADPNAPDKDGNPPLMIAAVFGSPSYIKLLLDKGANPKSANPMGASALLWAAGDPEKAKLLIDAGADVNQASGTGRTPLHAAATVFNGASTVKLMLDKGAKVDAVDKLDRIPVIFTGGGKATPLQEASRVGDLETLKILVRAGADVNAKDVQNGTALTEAVLYGRREIVKFLLANKASVNEEVSVLKFSTLSLAAMRNDAVVAKVLIDAGVQVNVQDRTGASPLMWAAYSDQADGEVVNVLLKAGADAKVRNKAGESALDWAAARGETKVVRTLREAGATPRSTEIVPTPKPSNEPVAMEVTLHALAKTGVSSFKKTGCVSCHNQMLPMVAFAAAKKHGMAVNEEASDQMGKSMMGFLKPMLPILLEGSAVPPDMAVGGGYILEALQAVGHQPDLMTASIVHNTVMQQMADGRFLGWAPRVPVEGGDIQATALAIRSMTLYPIPGRREELTNRTRSAGLWLRRAHPVTTEDYIMRLLGLKWAGMPAADLEEAARQLAAIQRKDGGWGQLPALPTDAYATAKATYAMREAFPNGDKGISVKKGIGYLLDNRLADGTWYVRTRSFPFQQLKDSDFPHGRDQWISAAATSWAAIVLIPENASSSAKRRVKAVRNSSASE